MGMNDLKISGLNKYWSVRFLILSFLFICCVSFIVCIADYQSRFGDAEWSTRQYKQRISKILHSSRDAKRRLHNGSRRSYKRPPPGRFLVLNRAVLKFSEALLSLTRSPRQPLMFLSERLVHRCFL